LAVVLATPVRGQKALEVQIHGIGTFADDRFLGGGLGLALRGNGRMRVGAYANGGGFQGEAAFRPELMMSFHLNPYKRSGVSPYFSGGVAVVVAGETREYIVGSVGLEWKPGASSGWFVEAGIGGGLRVAAGFQLRKRPGRQR
jgi:hypothetical protein